MHSEALDGLTDFLDLLPVGAILKSAHSRVVVYVNHRAATLLGSAEHDLVGQRLDAFWSKDTAAEQDRHDEALLNGTNNAASTAVAVARQTGETLQIHRSLIVDAQQLPTYLLYLLHETIRRVAKDDAEAQPRELIRLAQNIQLQQDKADLERELSEAQHRLAQVSGRQRIALIELLVQLESMQARRDSSHLSNELAAMAERAKGMLSVVDDAVITTFGNEPSWASLPVTSLLTVVQDCLSSLDIAARSGGARLTMDEATLQDLSLSANAQVLKALLIQLLSALLMGREQPTHIHIRADRDSDTTIVLQLTVQAAAALMPAIQRQIAGPSTDRRRNHIRFAVAACHLIDGEFELETLTLDKLRITLRFAANPSVSAGN